MLTYQCDFLSGVVQIYRNGASVGNHRYNNALTFPHIQQSKVSLGFQTNDMANLNVGMMQYSSSAFHGYLSGFYMWNRALTYDEVKQSYLRTSSMPKDNLIIDWYDFGKVLRADRQKTVRKFGFKESMS